MSSSGVQAAHLLQVSHKVLMAAAALKPGGAAAFTSRKQQSSNEAISRCWSRSATNSSWLQPPSNLASLQWRCNSGAQVQACLSEWFNGPGSAPQTAMHHCCRYHGLQNLASCFLSPALTLAEVMPTPQHSSSSSSNTRLKGQNSHTAARGSSSRLWCQHRAHSCTLL